MQSPVMSQLKASAVASLLEVINLRVSYRARDPQAGILSQRRELAALDDVSLSVAAGETYALIGESGSGKSSLVNAVAGLVPVKGGRILVNGEDVTQLPPGKGARRRIAILSQDAAGSLSPRLTVGTSMAEALRHAGVSSADFPAETSRLLGLVGLPLHLPASYPHQLSGGQARRVAVARALALRPDLIVADEPTAGLDVSVQGEIINLLMRLQRELGLAMLVISHNLHVVRLMGSRVGVIYLGRLVEEGPSAQVFAEPAHPYTAGLCAANLSSDPNEPWPSMPIGGDVPSLFDRPKGCVLHPRCPRATEHCRIQAPERRVLSAARMVECHWPLAEVDKPVAVGGSA
jgi:oligopeptide/dipeptide ABC transporter ATP-binding protein